VPDYLDDELFNDLGCMYFDSSESGRLIMLARIYLDESADGEAREIYVAAGFIGIPVLWERLRRKWKLQLKASAKKHGLKKLEYFSSKDCHNLRGPFYPLRDFGPVSEMKKTALQIRDELEPIITSSPIQGVGVAINMKDFREYNSRPEVLSNPNWNSDYKQKSKLVMTDSRLSILI
jgi:hypothetical protein